MRVSTEWNTTEPPFAAVLGFGLNCKAGPLWSVLLTYRDCPALSEASVILPVQGRMEQVTGMNAAWALTSPPTGSRQSPRAAVYLIGISELMRPSSAHPHISPPPPFAGELTLRLRVPPTTNRIFIPGFYIWALHQPTSFPKGVSE